jgi:8-oxo-dGTP pyrophosphatase MutT (NUDIX family)
MSEQFSSGGVVFKKQGDKNLILVCQHSMHHGWVFPKGLIGDHIEGESKEATALREVEEETGVKGKIIKLLNPVDYWYFFSGDPSAGHSTVSSDRIGSGPTEIHKTVYYFLMEYVSGDIAKHDLEMDNVEWLPVSEVEDRLTYPSDKKVWQEVRKDLASSI